MSTDLNAPSRDDLRCGDRGDELLATGLLDRPPLARRKRLRGRQTFRPADFVEGAEFARQTLLPLTREITAFFDQHWPRGEDGKILFKPAASLETWHSAVNPAPEIVGLNIVLTRLLALPADWTDAERRAAECSNRRKSFVCNTLGK